MTIRVFTGIVVLLLANLTFAQPANFQTKTTTSRFIENKGQIIDQDNNLNPEVL